MESRNIRQLVFWCLLSFLGRELMKAQDFNAIFLRLPVGEGVHLVAHRQGAVAQRTDYYPYGLPMRQKSADAQPYKYSGKEFDPINGLNTYDFHARAYHPDKIVFGSQDILAVKTPQISPHVFCAANPVMISDPTGMDTVRVNLTDGEWVIEPSVVCEGDDVIIVCDGAKSSMYVFDEGEYGNRMIGVVLEDDGKTESFGIYHLSGTNISGFMLQPEGPENPNEGSNKRIPVGSYSTTTGGSRWKNYIQINVEGTGRIGIAVHYGVYRTDSKGCVLLSYSYERVNGRTKFNPDSSRNAVWDYAQYLGAVSRTENVLMPNDGKNKTRRKDLYEYQGGLPKNSTVTLKNRWGNFY